MEKSAGLKVLHLYYYGFGLTALMRHALAIPVWPVSLKQKHDERL
jgi:hypothetical protein